MNREEINKIGFIEEDVPGNINLTKEIKRLKKEKNAIILAHYYQKDEIQDISDFVGDSLDLSKKAKENNADMIVFCGVHFMAETAKILSPNKKVLIPDLNAGCSLADSIMPERLKSFKEKYNDYIVVSYINTTAEIKTLTDIVCTSSNALNIINQIPKEQKIIFTPDKNLGKYIKNKAKRENMVLWSGACHVHNNFSIEYIYELKDKYQDAKIISHPECDEEILNISDHIGSTSSLLNYIKNDNEKRYIVVTEPGIIHQMKKINQEKEYIPVTKADDKDVCNYCEYMRLITMKKLYLTLKYELPEINLSKDIIENARKPIDKMLNMS